MDINNEMQEIGKRIKKARIDSQMTQVELHHLTDISITQISAYENGKRNIGLQSLYKIAQATNKTMDELYAGNIKSKIPGNGLEDIDLATNYLAFLVEKRIISCKLKEGNVCNYGTLQTDYEIVFLDYYDALLKDMILKLQDFYQSEIKYHDPDDIKSQITKITANNMKKYYKL